MWPYNQSNQIVLVSSKYKFKFLGVITICIYYLHYKIQKHIPLPMQNDYITDKENAIQNVIKTLYHYTKQSLCLYHVNKNIVYTIFSNQLTKYIKKCKQKYWVLDLFKVQKNHVYSFSSERIMESWIPQFRKLICKLKKTQKTTYC